MKLTLRHAGWAVGLAAVLIGFAVTVAISAEPAKKADPDFTGATYLGVAKCKMCHQGMPATKPIVTAWALTKHGKLNSGDEPLPWKADEKPAPEVAYRYTTGYDPAANTWKDKGVTCEACHGPGSKHMAGNKHTTLVNPANFTSAGQKVSLCGRCHGQYTIDGNKYAAKFLPGQDLLANDGFKLDPIQPGKAMDQLNEFVTSKHYTEKKMACETCHAPHSATAVQPYSLKKPVVELCTSCHTDKSMAKHAPNAPAGATCATCHMPKGVHTFTKPGEKGEKGEKGERD